MAPSFDCSVSSLLCVEENDSVLDGNDYRCEAVMESDTIYHHRNHRSVNNDFPFDGGNGLSLQSDEYVTLMLEKECDYMPCFEYLKKLQNGDLDLGARREVIDWMEKVHAHYHFGPLCAYLSVNYLDRFLSAYELPKGKAWTMQLLAVACLSLAAKMEESEVPLSLDLQVGEAKFVFEAKTIERMELLVLSTLKWRMQAVTPYSFIDYFLNKIGGDQMPFKILISRSIKLISSIATGIEFLKFKPSEVASAVAIAIIAENRTIDEQQPVSPVIQHVEKERLLKCVELIKAMSLVKNVDALVPPVPQSPLGILDAAACLSYKSNETTIGSCANSVHNTPDTKKRKLNRPCEL